MCLTVYFASFVLFLTLWYEIYTLSRSVSGKYGKYAACAMELVVISIALPVPLVKGLSPSFNGSFGC